MSFRAAASQAALISLTKPFTPATINTLRTVLQPIPDVSNSALNQPCASKRRNAAVLIPFCNVGGEPGILLEVRAKTLRSHSGEISFPGGRIDDTDESLTHGALRETQEELGVDPSRVEILGEIGPPEMNLRGDMRVWPIVGFIHSESEQQIVAADEPFPSLDMDVLRKRASPSEVATAIHLPLKAFASPARVRSSMFRGHEPYWAVDVTDLVQAHLSEDDVTRQQGETVDEVGPGVDGKIEVWGLTGWYLSLLMKALRVYR
ncbi:hypothetical protein BDN70DRAFT_877512 [Pholiota conissans]|uniref:Nudix hydrolase domain-containing protein n=1 Tax=Pholiota conissans TaxID=109636 RepID=A0A9P5Z308_9AGAR|nr:hypothetical protein BDN70DRAFT_877512 [Pholiota conissans]